MGSRRRLDRKTEDRRPVVTDDFIYDDPSDSNSAQEEAPFSDTPEEAVRKLRRRKADPETDPVSADVVPDGTPDDESSSLQAIQRQRSQKGVPQWGY